jgi:branched-chain amino acid transport system permease protein
MMKNFLRGTKKSGLGLAAGFVLLVALPFLISEGWLSIVIEIMIMMLAACALNVILGYGGMVSFGPAGLYAVGAYTTALLLTKTGIPFAIAMIAGPIAAGVAGVIVGWFCVRRTTVYFALLTLAFSQIIWTVIFEWYGFTGGDNGIVGVPVPDFLMSITHYYYFSLVIIAVFLIILWKIVNSPFGKTLQAIRENPGRTKFIGINVRRYQLIAFVISSVFLGAAGTLFCGFSHSVFPDYAHWVKSTDMLIICLLGGIFNFSGPIMGSIIYILLSKLISSYTMYWLLLLGIIVVFLMLFMRGGIMGFILEKFSPGISREIEVGR